MKGPSTGSRRQAEPTAWAGALAALALALTSCSVAPPLTGVEHPDLQGEWSYGATDVQIVGRSGDRGCTIQGMALHLGPWRATGFYGRTEGGVLVCEGTLAVLNGALPSYPVRRGGMVSESIAFDIGTPDWRNEGTLRADTMSGTLRLTNGSLQLTGRFRAVRGSGR
jgi:hypothetical protein